MVKMASLMICTYLTLVGAIKLTQEPMSEADWKHPRDEMHGKNKGEPTMFAPSMANRQNSTLALSFASFESTMSKITPADAEKFASLHRQEYTYRPLVPPGYEQYVNHGRRIVYRADRHGLRPDHVFQHGFKCPYIDKGHRAPEPVENYLRVHIEQYSRDPTSAYSHSGWISTCSDLGTVAGLGADWAGVPIYSIRLEGIGQGVDVNEYYRDKLQRSNPHAEQKEFAVWWRIRGSQVTGYWQNGKYTENPHIPWADRVPWA